MEFKYQLTSVEKSKKAVIANRSLVGKVDDVYKELDDEHKKLLKQSCFGNLIKLPEINAHQIVHNLLMRQVKGDSKETFWFRIGSRCIRFSLKEFALVTGFKFGSTDGIVDGTNAKECRLVKKYFKNKHLIIRNDVLKAFEKVKVAKDKYKLGLIVILCYVLLAGEEKVSVAWWLFKLVDNLDAFNMYPWGSLCYEYTVRVFNRNLADSFKDAFISYTLNGFPYALTVWALESIPCLQSLGMLVDKKGLPRMRKWSVPTRLSASTVRGLLEMEEVEVNPTLVPSKSEKRKPYCVAIMEEDEGDVSDHVEIDFSESADNLHFPKPENVDKPCEGVPQPCEGVDQPSTSGYDIEKVKDDVLSIVREENKALHSALKAIQEKVVLLEAKSRQPLFCEKCKNVITEDMGLGGEENEGWVGAGIVNEVDVGGAGAGEEKEEYECQEKEKEKEEFEGEEKEVEKLDLDEDMVEKDDHCIKKVVEDDGKVAEVVDNVSDVVPIRVMDPVKMVEVKNFVDKVDHRLEIEQSKHQGKMFNIV